MKKNLLFTCLATLGLTIGAHAAGITSMPFGIVNFESCIADSKYGKQEQTSFEVLRKQMTTLLEDTEKQLHEINAKFSDPDYLDGLSPDAEAELKIKFQNLNEELNRYQNQYYQVLNQAQMRIMQVVGGHINTASENVAKEKKLALVVNKGACCFYNPQLDITSTIISEMDKQFDQETLKKEGGEPVVAPQTEAAAG